jgi:hypothetical protein
MLADRLEKHAMGEIELTTTQVRAAEILLKKVVPDLASITHKGDPDNPLEMRYFARTVVDPNPSAAAAQVSPASQPGKV